MDYEKEYKKRLDDARYWHDVSEGDIPLVLEEIFSELRESEEERIRGEITEFLKKASGGFLDTTTQCKTFGKWLAWLEKQGQKSEKKELKKIENHPLLSDFFNAEYERSKADALKSAEWSNEDELQLQAAIEICENSGHTITSNWLKSLKNRIYPKQEWSEEDKERYISCLQRLGTGNPDQPETINSKWFKEHVTFLPKRKPSDEQMHYLANIKLGNSVVK